MTIVVGHDGSDSGDDAAVLGARLARATGEDLLVVTVYPEENPIGIGRVDAEWVGAMRDHAREVSECAKRFLDERSVSASYHVIGSGSAAHGLDDVAEAEHASMIVVGSERHGARRRISPGSTGERLLHGAICPVAVAPRGFRERAGDTPIKRIGVSFVDTPEAHEALRFAAEPLSLSEPLREDGDAELGDIVEDRSAESPFEVAATALLPDEIEKLLAPLDERERQILALRFGLDRGEPRTLEEVGEFFNLTRERIRQIEARAMSKLRHPSADTGARDLLAV